MEKTISKIHLELHVKYENYKMLKLKNILKEQFDITTDIDNEVMGKTKTSTPTQDKTNQIPSVEKQDKPSVKKDKDAATKDDAKKDRSELVTNQSNLVKGKLTHSYRLKIKLDPNGLAFREFLIPDGSDLIFNPATKTWLIYPKNENAYEYGYHIFKYKMGSNEYSYYGKGSWQERARWQASSLSRWLNSDKFVEHLKSVYTANDPKLNLELSKCLEIAKDLRTVTTTNPNKYFWRFRSTTNDLEKEAAAWFVKAWNKAWGADLEKLSRSNNRTIRQNVADINYFAQSVYDVIRLGRQTSALSREYLVITNPENNKQTIFKISWQYM